MCWCLRSWSRYVFLKKPKVWHPASLVFTVLLLHRNPVLSCVFKRPSRDAHDIISKLRCGECLAATDLAEVPHQRGRRICGFVFITGDGILPTSYREVL